MIEIEECDSKENRLTPTKVSTGMSQIDSTEDNLGGISRTVKTTDSLAIMEEIQEPQVARMCSRNPENPSDRGKSNGRFVQMLELKHDGTSNTLTSVQKDNLVVLRIPEATAKGYAEAEEGDSVNLEQPNSKTRRGRVGKQMANTLTTSCNQGVVIGAAEVQQVGNVVDDTNIGFKNPQRGRVYSADGLSPCLNCCGGGGLEPKIVEQDMTTIIGNKQKNPFRGTTEEISPCITSACGAGGGMTPMLTDAPLEYARTEEFIEQLRGHQEPRYRIRKLTPRECFRLMDVDDNMIDKIQAAGISNSQQYKMAGNSIVVACLYGIFEQLFYPKYTNSGTLF